MTVKEWLQKTMNNDIYYIGYSNGYSYIVKIAKQHNKKEQDLFLNHMLSDITAEIKRIDGLSAEKYPIEYKNGYKMALSVSRLDLLRALLHTRVGDNNDSV